MRNALLRKGRDRAARKVPGVLTAALLAVSATGCSRCSTVVSAKSAEELLPDRPMAAVITAPLAAVALHLSDLFARAAQIPGGEQLEANRRAAAAQLGFDPLTSDGLASAGLDPDRGAAVAILAGEPRPGWIAALPLSKRDAFGAHLDGLLRERAGFPERTEETRSGTRIATFSRAGEPEKISYAVLRGYAVVSRGADPAAEVAAAAARRPEQSLSAAERLRSAREDVGPQDVVVLAAEGTLGFRGAAARAVPGNLSGETAIGLTGTSGGISAKIAYRGSDQDVTRIRAALPGGAGGLARLLPTDAPVRMRLGLAPSEVLAQARRVPDLAQALDTLAASGVDPLRDVVLALSPGAAIAVALSPSANLGAVVDYGIFDWRKRSPFESLQIVALAPVADEARLAGALDSLAKALPRMGAQVKRTAEGWQVRYPGGEGPRFGIASLAGQKVAWLAGGFGGRDLRAMLQGTPDRSPAAAALTQDPGIAVRLDLAALATRVRALPQSTYGTGPQAYVARSLVAQIIEPLSALSVSASAIPTDRGLRAEVDVAIAPAGQR